MFERGFEVTDIALRADAGVPEGAHGGVHELGEGARPREVTAWAHQGMVLRPNLSVA